MVVQYKIDYLKIKSNLLKFERLIKKYRFFKPDLVVFPEYALTGPLYGHYDLALSQNDQVVEDLKELARRYGVNIIPGSLGRIDNGRKFNSTCFIDGYGKLEGFYDKQKLWSSEKKFLVPGSESMVWNTKLGRIGIQICADLISPQVSADYLKSKPEIIINLAMWSKEDVKAAKKKVVTNLEINQTEVLAKARALENRAYFVFCNYGGGVEIKARSGRFYEENSVGNSMVVSPYGEIIAKAMGENEEVLMVEIDLAKCHWADY
jgi:predicted amidohydrolase